ncbi:hypothetical protein GCM10027280_60740 [Micromonospora polyrhachis]
MNQDDALSEPTGYEPTGYERDMPAVQAYVEKFERARAKVQSAHARHPVNEVRAALAQAFDAEGLKVWKEADVADRRRGWGFRLPRRDWLTTGSPGCGSTSTAEPVSAPLPASREHQAAETDRRPRHRQGSTDQGVRFPGPSLGRHRAVRSRPTLTKVNQRHLHKQAAQSLDRGSELLGDGRVDLYAGFCPDGTVAGAAGGGHPSRPTVAGRLQRSTRRHRAGRPQSPARTVTSR